MTDNNKPGKIYQQIAKVMADIAAIGKDSQNKAQNFKFRGIDAVYNELHQHLSKHAVFTTTDVLEFNRESRTTNAGGTMIYTVAKIKYRFYADDGSSVESVVIGEAGDTGDKSSNKAMAIAHKYAFLQIFTIPTEGDNDPDKHAHVLATSQTFNPNNKPTPPPIVAPSTPTPSNTRHEPLGRPRAFTISEAQGKRMFAIAKTNGWVPEQLKEYLKLKFNIEHTKDLNREQYDEICDAVLPNMAFDFAMSELNAIADSEGGNDDILL